MKKTLRAVLPEKLVGKEKTVVPLVRLHGVIGQGSRFNSALNLANVEERLETAFKMKKAPLVALSINSPGGSPVQSHLIYKRIRQLASEHSKQVLVFVEDVAASGGYFIALAGDEIIVDASSVVGSIGVVSAGFGFEGLIEKIGVERRVYTAGTKKATLDPFQPENAEDVAHLKGLQKELHAHFIGIVKERRARSLADDADVFNGLFWSGSKGVELGLADKLGSLYEELHARFGEDVKLKEIEAKSSWFASLLSSGRTVPSLEAAAVHMPAAVLAAAEERSHWQRFGL
ncbi:S49 family peptidase [Polycladidibacter hongkongensis]|uniref:S49 family peptidase n=1 Tax=Polycladidibacter hongkongensis TaxID=1647556 RepID=UPI0008312641|nr:S49 family peptidase [Pseudovibrio hongkongensis]